MAREVPYGMKIEGASGAPMGYWKSGVTVRKSSSGKITKTGSVSKKKKAEVESTSYRGKELTKAERKKIREQNKAAESAKSKDLDKVESAKKAAQTRKLRQEEKEEYAYRLGKKSGRKSGRIEGAAGTAVVGAAGLSLLNKKKKEDKKSKSNKKKK